jgi:hypothetical protein
MVLSLPCSLVLHQRRPAATGRQGEGLLGRGGGGSLPALQGEGGVFTACWSRLSLPCSIILMRGAARARRRGKPARPSRRRRRVHGVLVAPDYDYLTITHRQVIIITHVTTRHVTTPHVQSHGRLG